MKIPPYQLACSVQTQNLWVFRAAQLQEDEHRLAPQMGLENLPTGQCDLAQLIRAKYPSATDIFSSSGQGGSQFWKNLDKIKHFFKLGVKHEVKDGNRTIFWQDQWVSSEPLSQQFPLLFSICDNQSISVAKACGPSGHILFRCSLDPAGARSW
jgi:hypothetical protein